MASTFSSLKFELIGTGEQDGTWGDTTNTNLGTAIEQAITGSGDVTFASADVTLTLSNTNAAQVARNLRLVCVGTSGGARQLIVPAIEKQYIVQNDLADSVTIRTPSGTGVLVPAGKTTVVFNNGTNVVDAITHLSSFSTGNLSASNISASNISTGNINASNISATSLTLSSALGVASGGTGATTLTANNVVLGNGTSTVQFVAPGSSGNVLTSNGTTWASAVPSGFPAGTVLLFYQISAPTGWTQVTTQNNKALRVVSGTGGGTGGSVGFTTAFATPTVAGSVGATTLSTAQIPTHNHNIQLFQISGCAPFGVGANQVANTIFGNQSTQNEGSSGSHTHSLSGATATINVQYIDIILASKD